MTRNCEHDGFHSGEAKLSPEFGSIRYVLVCDECGEEMREVHVETYRPDFDPSGNEKAQRAA
jgi:hypothetical protein